MHFPHCTKRCFGNYCFPMDINFIKVCFIRKLIRNSVFLSLQKERYAPYYTVYLDMLPYCMDIEKEIEDVCDISDELGFDLPGLMKNLNHLCFIQNRKS